MPHHLKYAEAHSGTTLERPSRANGANFVEGLPRILFALQALHALGFGFFLGNFAHLHPLLGQILRVRSRKFGGKNEMPATALCCVAGIGEAVDFKILKLRPRILCRTQQHTAATTGRTLHGLNIRLKWSDLQVCDRRGHPAARFQAVAAAASSSPNIS